jgi:hypothetical protein
LTLNIINPAKFMRENNQNDKEESSEDEVELE